MGTPSEISSVINLTPTNPSMVGSVNIVGFLANSSSTNWVAKVTDVNGENIFYVNQSLEATQPVALGLARSIFVKDLDMSTSSAVSSIIIYREW